MIEDSENWANEINFKVFNLTKLCNIYYLLILLTSFGRGHAVALRYTPEGHGFDSQWCHWNFSFT